MTGTRHVGLFVTCLVDFFRPTTGFAAVALLERAGCRVDVPLRQVCCGQPAYNSGDAANARRVARQTVDLFERHDYVVAPSGSCAAMLRRHYPELLAEDSGYAKRARRLAEKTSELTSFLADAAGFRPAEADWRGAATYHDACSGLRELGISEQPRRLLAQVGGLELVEQDASDACCGFGGTFCVKHPEISTAMVDRKVDSIAATGATTVLSGDLGCLLNIAGRMSRRNIAVEARHVAELLAGMADVPAIGSGK